MRIFFPIFHKLSHDYYKDYYISVIFSSLKKKLRIDNIHVIVPHSNSDSTVQLNTDDIHTYSYV